MAARGLYVVSCAGGVGDAPGGARGWWGWACMCG